MEADLAMICTTIREAGPGSTLLLAANIYDQILDALAAEPTASAIAARGLQIRREPTLKPGTLMLMAAGHVLAPPTDWAGGFLAKSGPAAPRVVATHTIQAAAAPASPPPPPPPRRPPPQRQRIVDT